MKYSDEAFRVYDTDGEMAMVSFLVDNRDESAVYNNPDTDPFKEGVFPLPDTTRVTFDGDGKTYHNSHTGETRPKTLTDEQIPPFPMLPVQLFNWPDSGDVRARAVQTVLQEAVAREGLPAGTEPLLRTAETLAAAPGLDAAVMKVIERQQEAGAPDDIAEILDEIQREYAREALAMLPDGQRKALEQAARDSIRRGETE